MRRVVLEGADACGKATHAKLLAGRFGGTVISFPNYESSTGRAILGHLKKQWAVSSVDSDETLDALVFQSLMSTNRLEALSRIAEAEERGPIFFDRYWPSAVVYGGLDGLDREWLMATQARPMPEADAYVLLDVPVEEGFRRRPERRDRYEKDREFLERVRTGYLELFRSREAQIDTRPVPDDDDAIADYVCAWHVVDGMGEVEEVHERIVSAIRKMGVLL